jgi:hypothetical protein
MDFRGWWTAIPLFLLKDHSQDQFCCKLPIHLRLRTTTKTNFAANHPFNLTFGPPSGPILLQIILLTSP